ncbi:Uncharacterized conserved protein YegJ, DUF2314 family [Chitinophaga sp. CF118]|uniref:YegJ family protein n=1 Tax=Chitinophaga sp. CF118 TaxID=1884367 RepID=UPI0008E11D6A|nr:DUF2314 domain-containing protein [Chitinophaga sp. CF118]SFE11859.1 Uncharacterized conserved protein YegJ, DUF2314 family [Chitinophaga sp. CF118]
MGLLSRLFGKRKEPAKDEESLPVVNVAGDDIRMNWAIEKARATLHYFQNSLTAPQSHQQYFSVKVLIEDGLYHEHLWLTTPSFDDEGNLYGIVGNKPVSVSSVSVNQRIGIESQYISDWMIIEDGRLVGGYTIRAIRDGLPESERLEFDRMAGLYIDEGVDYFIHDFSTPEGAILCLEDAYDDQDIDKAISCKNFEEEARLLLKGMHRTLDNEDILQATAEVLRQSFIKNLTEEGFPLFKDIDRVYPLREKISNNLYLITEVCVFPDGGRSVQKIYTFKNEDGWKVLGIEG